MTGKLMTAIIAITSALLFYTIGVWSEHRSRKLKKIHLIFFWLGLCMDTIGTILMGQIAEHSMFSGKVSLHGVTGALAIILMIVHAVWATVVLVKNKENATENFHKFSVAVWAVWLVPYILGMVIGMKP
ncbi:MAG: TIGR03987 family protein [Lachnospiraceae bacterium]|nr:TIGR03987 family protein [Lachnospiraceae bacterium]